MNQKLGTLLLTTLPWLGYTQSNDTTQLREAVVTSVRDGAAFNQTARNVTVITREEIEQAPAQSVNELLEHVLNVDVRQRGALGVQADISMRGGSFEQTLILLNGIKMTDPQTGHHNMNLPVELDQIERIEVLHGGASRVFGLNAFAGAINIITKNPQQSEVSAHVTGGEYGYYETGASAAARFKQHSHQVSVSKRASDGYIPNSDFDLTNLFWQSQVELKNARLFFNAGQTDRAFGAQNFYSSNFPDQFEATRSQFISGFGEINLGALTLKPRAYYRRHFDRFELFREGGDYYQRVNDSLFIMDGDTAPSWYPGHNYHFTEVHGYELNASYRSRFGLTSLGADYRWEGVKSNQLGEDLNNPEQVEGEHPSAFYTQQDDRENISLYMEHNVAWKNLFVSAGFMYNINSRYDNEWFPGIDVAYQFIPQVRAYASFNRSLRFPSFTDLYYNLGGAVGSDSLLPETSLNYEGGMKIELPGVRGHVAYFRREGRDLIDWIRFNGSDITQAANITEVDINGVETSWHWDLRKQLGADFPIRTARIGYTYLWADTASTNFESNYVLDFLEHKFDLGLDQYFSDRFWISWNVSYQQRTGGFFSAEAGEEVSFEPVLLTDVRLTHDMRYARLFVEVSNLFDETYADIGNVVQPGRWLRAGISVRIPVNFPKSDAP